MPCSQCLCLLLSRPGFCPPAFAEQDRQQVSQLYWLSLSSPCCGGVPCSECTDLEGGKSLGECGWGTVAQEPCHGHLNCGVSLNDSALERWATCCMTGSSKYLNCIRVLCTCPEAPMRGWLGGTPSTAPPRPHEPLDWVPSSRLTQYYPSHSLSTRRPDANNWRQFQLPP